MPSLLEEPEDQEVLNVAAWERAVVDETLEKVPFRVETDRFGRYVMSPLNDVDHGYFQASVSFCLDRCIPHGTVSVECPLSTSEGVKLIDSVWLSPARRPPEGAVCLTIAPEICIEIEITPTRVSEEKKRLYFEAGAEEVWFCLKDGGMQFFAKAQPDTCLAKSPLCPAFPANINEK